MTTGSLRGFLACIPSFSDMVAGVDVWEVMCEARALVFQRWVFCNLVTEDGTAESRNMGPDIEEGRAVNPGKNRNMLY